MASLPTEYPRWATNDPVDPVSLQPAILEPSEGKKDSGFTRFERPTRQDYNWLFNLINSWIEWLEQELDLVKTGVVDHTSGLGSFIRVLAGRHPTAYPTDQLGNVLNGFAVLDPGFPTIVQITSNSFLLPAVYGVTFLTESSSFVDGKVLLPESAQYHGRSCYIVNTTTSTKKIKSVSDILIVSNREVHLAPGMGVLLILNPVTVLWDPIKPSAQETGTFPLYLFDNGVEIAGTVCSFVRDREAGKISITIPQITGTVSAAALVQLGMTTAGVLTALPTQVLSSANRSFPLLVEIPGGVINVLPFRFDLATSVLRLDVVSVNGAFYIRSQTITYNF